MKTLMSRLCVLHVLFQPMKTLMPVKKQAVCAPCDVPAMECEGGSFRWDACESIVFEWSLTDPNELANDDDMEQKCATKEELLCTA